VGGSIPVVWTYFGEFQPAARRGAACSVLASFWMVGNVAVAALAWAVIPHNIGWSDPDSFQFNSWRVFVALCALPSLLVAAALVRLPESPQFLASKGRAGAALAVLRRMHAGNGGQRGAYPVQALAVDRVSPHIMEEKQGLGAAVREALSKAGQLFAPGLVRYTTIMVVINFTIQFGYYGLWLWFPELFNKLETYYQANPNATVTVCEVIDFQVGARLLLGITCPSTGRGRQ
jgi:VNT family MFS transporter (synaptic vesicle glycoprotein 2)